MAKSLVVTKQRVQKRHISITFSVENLCQQRETWDARAGERCRAGEAWMEVCDCDVDGEL